MTLRRHIRERPHVIQGAIPFLWIVLSMAWAVVILVTDQLAWPLALWIATTVGPLTTLQNRNDTRQIEDR